MVQRRTAVRAVLVIVVLLSVLALGQSYTAAREGDEFDIRRQAQLPEEERVPIAPPTDGTTVVTTQRRKNADRAPGSIFAIDGDGRVQYYDQTYHSYWDVDPVPGEDQTVVYVASEDADDACPNVECWRNVVERVDLTTGEVTRLYEQLNPTRGSSRWHDADFVNQTHLAVADIYRDEVFVVDVRTGIVEWTWKATATFSPTSGGNYPDDWTHVNDVERLADGRIMVSLRNHDQVVFVDPSEGLHRDWTLGSDDAHSTLYEQHNPDFIPAERGGPSVLVANSESSYLAEFQRTDGEWRETWRWSDARLQWPRDADRLPDGSTLVTDTHGGRVLEVEPDGSIAWQVTILAPYEAERLGTGDESAGGPSAAQAGLASRRPEIDDDAGFDGGPIRRVLFVAPNYLPQIVVNGLLWVVPPWMGATDLIVAGAGLVAFAALVIAETFWRCAIGMRSPFAGSVRSPIVVSRRRGD